MLTVLTQLKEMYDLGFFGEFAMSDAYADGPEFMASGEYAMTVRQTAFVNIVESAYGVPASTFGFFVMPLADSQCEPIQPDHVIMYCGETISAEYAFSAGGGCHMRGAG